MVKRGIKFESRAARLAKELGYTHIASTVKQVFNTTYHNVNSCNSVIEAGEWPGASFHGRYNCRMGVIASEIDWSKTIDRATLHANLRNKEESEDNQKFCTADYDVDSCDDCGECDN